MNLCTVLIKHQPFSSKPSSNRSEKLNSNEDAPTYAQVRQQYTREGVSSLKGKGKDPLTFGSNRGEKLNPNEDAHAYERVRQQYIRGGISPLKGKGKDPLTISSTSSWSAPPAYRPPPLFSPPSATATYDDSAHARSLQAQLDKERASYDLARQLQAQEDATVREHRLLVQEAARVKLFECVICMESYPHDYSAPVRSCGHVLCRDCMKEHVQSQVDQSVWPIRCPTCVADASRTEEQGGEHEPAPLLKRIED